MSELFTRPRYFRDVTFHKHTDRTVGWLELFYDLVYVATLIQIGNFLSDNLTVLGFGQFMVMMFVVWWAWSAETLYQNRYVVDDIWHRLLVFIQILGVATIGLSVSGAFGELSVQFALGYVLVRLVLIVMYVRVIRSHPESKTFATHYMMGFAGGIAIWLVSIFLPTDIQWITWLVAIAFEALFFSRPVIIEELQLWAADDHHLVERFGIFTIIVLGEAFVKVLDDAQGTSLGLQEITFGIIGVGVLCSLWWLYFSDTAGKLYDFSSTIKGQSWSWGHLLLASSLVTFGVAMKKLFGETISYSDKVVTDEYRLIFTAGIALFLLAMSMIDFGLDDALTPHKQILKVMVYLVAAALVVVVGFFVTGLTATLFTALIAAIMVALVGFNVYLSATAPPAPEHHAEAH